MEEDKESTNVLEPFKAKKLKLMVHTNHVFFVVVVLKQFAQNSMNLLQRQCVFMSGNTSCPSFCEIYTG